MPVSVLLPAGPVASSRDGAPPSSPRTALLARRVGALARCVPAAGRALRTGIGIVITAAAAAMPQPATGEPVRRPTPPAAAPASPAPASPAPAAPTTSAPAIPIPAVTAPVKAPAAAMPIDLAAPDPGTPAGGPALQLTQTRARLPDGRLDRPYDPIVLARGGVGGYRFTTAQGRLPPGLAIVDGVLAGQPAQAGVFEFVLEVRDAGSPPQSVRQAYSMRIAPAPPPRRPAGTLAARPAPALDTVSPTLAESTLRPADEGLVVIYRLSRKTLDSVAPPSENEAAVARPASAAPDPAAFAREAVELLRRMQDKLDEIGLPRGTLDAQAWAATADADADPGPAAVARAGPGGPAPRPVDLRQLRELLLPLVDVEYPNRPLFEAALRGRQCGYLVELLRQGHQARAGVDSTPPRVDCPRLATPGTQARTRTPAAGRPTPGAGWTLRAFHDSLLPDAVREQIVEESRVVHDRAAAADVRWRAARCDCVRPIGDHDVVYGIHPFWRSGPVGEEPPVDFSRFHRVSILGVQLDDRMEVPAPGGWRATVTRLAATARQHDTAMDLLLQREDWQPILALPLAQVPERAALAARSVHARFDETRLTAWSALVGTPGREDTSGSHVFSGVTVMFTPPPVGASKAGEAAAQRFEVFYQAFVTRLIQLLKSSGRDVVLNLVIPDHAIGRDGVFAWRRLDEYIHLAQKETNPTLPEGSDLAGYRPADDGGNDITVRLLVTLSEPTTLSKKDLRRRIDESDVVKGHNRVALLNGIVPVMFHPTGDAVAPLIPTAAEQINDDLAYFRHNFGGVALWPLPVRSRGAGNDVLCTLERNYFERLPPSPDCDDPTRRGDGHSRVRELGHLVDRAQARACTWICPNREPIQAVGAVLGLFTLAGLVTWRLTCTVRRYGPLVPVLLWALGLSTVAVGIALLVCDPRLHAVRDGNAILYVLLVVIAALGLWFSVRPRVAAP